ncbi:MAG: aspartate-semialdehyde dehydrogenase [Gammaproteobacteria bacterium RIFCSPHIGHO2_12_FULL_37_14]|nr:MAG: aspartate-semialdehyde dehydrogenase [Gammaproteobacteria bacterium RIFCSPHIGHO2_12_FULL_37_14]
MSTYSVAIVGATGLVGGALLALLEERKFPIKNLYLVASQQSVGKLLEYRQQSLAVCDLATFDFHQADIAFFCVGNDLAAAYIPKATAAGCIVIDKSYFYRNHPDVPLIIPEVNLHALADYRKLKIIASPNCNTIPIAVGIKAIYDAVGIERMNIATYQSVSGTGKDAILELTDQTKQWLANEVIQHKVYSQQIAFNVLPHIDDFQENGYTREEMKMVWEIRKIYNDDKLAINPTAVRVPVFCGHAASVHLETKSKITTEQAIQLLSHAEGVKVMTGEYPYPTPVNDAAGNDLVYVGRVREDISHQRGLNLWIVADNLRKGAALNAIQVAEYLIKDYLQGKVDKVKTGQ